MKQSINIRLYYINFLADVMLSRLNIKMVGKPTYEWSEDDTKDIIEPTQDYMESAWNYELSEEQVRKDIDFILGLLEEN